MKKIRILLVFLPAFILSSCENLLVKPSGSNRHTEDFEALWNRVNDVYPFLEFKKINWDSMYSVYRPLVTEAEGDNYLILLNDFLDVLKDGHLYYKLKGGSRIYPYYPQRYFRDRYTYNPFVVRHYFDKELTITESGSAEYQIMEENIGYIFLSEFHGEYLTREFPGIMNYMKDTKGLIIDIRQRRGGDYQTVLSVVSYFLQEPLEPPKLYILGNLIDQAPMEPRTDITYTQPVVVLINGSTFSAGEMTTEIMKQLPNVTAIGDTTGGGGVASSGSPPGAKGEFELPSGMTVYIGTGYVERYDGLPFEGIGIAPDILVEETPKDISDGIDRPLEYAIQLLR